MPRRDGTGPLGQGSRTGRGLGPCGGGSGGSGSNQSRWRNPFGQLGNFRRKRNKPGPGSGRGQGRGNNYQDW